MDVEEAGEQTEESGSESDSSSEYDDDIVEYGEDDIFLSHFSFIFLSQYVDTGPNRF